MKVQKIKFIFIAIGYLLMSSCTTLLYTSIDVLRPAKIAFAPEAKNLLIVNNTVVQPPNVGHVTQLLGESSRNILLQTDSLSIFCLGALNEELNGKNFFSSVTLLPESKNTSNNFSLVKHLTTDSVTKYSASNQSDAVLSLDKISVKDVLSEFYLAETGTFLSTLEVKFETSWSLYYPNSPKFSTLEFKDTIYWESESYFRKKSMTELPKRDDALIDGALYVGQKTVNRFVPYWEKVDRFFYNSNNKLIRRGIDSVYVKNWKNAILHWTKALTESKNALTQAQAANNIAVVYEIMGDIDKAIEYATQSYYYLAKQSFVNYDLYFRTTQYVTDLTLRKNEIAKLKIQLGE